VVRRQLVSPADEHVVSAPGDLHDVVRHQAVAALDRAEEKLRKQLEKASARPRRSRPSGVNPT
jgi:ribosome-associated translation inhibitor RaiA